MYSDYTSPTQNQSTCPHCGGYIDQRPIYVVASIDNDLISTAILKTSDLINHEPIRKLPILDFNEIFDYSINESLTPSHGYWPHWLHEKRVKEVSKPVNQFYPLPEFAHKQFMQLSTFKNLRFK